MVNSNSDKCQFDTDFDLNECNYARKSRAMFDLPVLVFIMVVLG